MKKLLVVVDMQNDFVSGSLGFSDSKKIIKNVIKHIEEFKKNNDDIVFTRDTHDSNYLKTTEGTKLPIEHCIKNTKGFNIIDELDSYTKNAKIFDKNGFVSIELANFVKENGYDDIYLVGLITDICVMGNAVTLKGAVGPYGKVSVFEDGVSTANKEMEEIAFKAMNNLHIDII
mgnify:CR=1 FL=1